MQEDTRSYQEGVEGVEGVSGLSVEPALEPDGGEDDARAGSLTFSFRETVQ